MPLLPDPITSDDLVSYLETTSDFQFEMDVFQMCRNSGLTTEHAGMYTDPATGKMREFDVRAFALRSYRGNQHHILRLAVECKNLKRNYPLLVSCVPRRPEESYHCAIFNPIVRTITGHSTSTTNSGSNTSTSSASHIAVEGVRFDSTIGRVFRVDEMVGKSTVQVGKSYAQQSKREKETEGIKTEFVAEDKEVYEGISQAVASCTDLIQQAKDDYKAFGNKFAATVLQPILVVADDTLWVSEYAPNGSRIGSPAMVKRCDFYLGQRVTTASLFGAFTISHVMIFTKSGFQEFLNLLNPYSTFSSSIWDCFFPELSIQNLKAKLEAELPFSLPKSFIPTSSPGK